MLTRIILNEILRQRKFKVYKHFLTKILTRFFNEIGTILHFHKTQPQKVLRLRKLHQELQ